MSFRMFLELHSQVGQDIIENGPTGSGVCTGGFGRSSGKAYTKVDEFQRVLWDQGIRVDVVSWDSEKNTVTIKGGDYATAMVATKCFRDKGYKVVRL